MIASSYRRDLEKMKERRRVSDDDEATPLPTIPGLFVETIKRSCLSSTLNTYLMNDSGKLTKKLLTLGWPSVTKGWVRAEFNGE